MPLAAADPVGGVIITEWYNDPSATDERVRLTSLLAGANCAPMHCVSVFRETNRRGQWVSTAASSKAARQLENIILTRPRFGNGAPRQPIGHYERYFAAYDPAEHEAHWQKAWQQEDCFSAGAPMMRARNITSWKCLSVGAHSYGPCAQLCYGRSGGAL